MPICPSGGVPRPGIPAFVAVVGTALEFLITRRAPWLAPFLIVLQPFSVDTTAFCGEEPPAFPEWEAADLFGLLTGGSQQKLVDTVKNVMWYEWCECDGAATPAAPVEPPPAELPTVQPSPIGNCDSVHVLKVYATPGGNEQVFPETFGAKRPLPVGATHIELTAEVAVQGVSGGGASPDNDQSVSIVWYNTAGATVSDPIGGVLLEVPTEMREVSSWAIPATAVSWQMWMICQPGGGPCPAQREVLVDVRILCGGNADRLAPSCCPPDPALMAKLDAVLEAITLVQRQGFPFAYVPGDSDAGLTGIGELAVGHLVAVSIELTTLPGHYGMAEGSPDAVFEVGFLAAGTADGFAPAVPIRHSNQYLRVGPEVTRIGYSLAPGVVATIRQHVREP